MPATTHPGAAFVRLTRRGDAAAFDIIYEAHRPAIYRFLVRRLGGDTALAEDLTSDVFIRAFRTLGRYEDRGLPFRAWLYRIARNRLIDYYRRLQFGGAICSLGEVFDIPEERTGRTLDGVLDRQVLTLALGRLTAEQRRVLELRFLEDRSTAETAEVTGTTEAAVKKRQARGLANLRRLLAPPQPSEQETTGGAVALTA